jgi:hypothetical protein
MKPQWQQQQQQQMRRQRQQQEQMRRQQQMQEQMQRQQEQMRQQQEQLRQRQMGDAWMEQQKARARKPRPDVLPQEKDRFAQVEGEVARLRQEMVAGRLTEEQFKARLRELMVQDAQGTWWMVGAETGGWYRHDGANWVRADRPGRVALRAAPQPVVRSIAPVKTKPRRFWGIVALLFGLALTFGAGMAVGALTHEMLYDSFYDIAYAVSLVCAGAVWLGGLVYSVRWARKIWRRE